MVYDIHGRMVSEEQEFNATEELRIRRDMLGLGGWLVFGQIFLGYVPLQFVIFPPSLYEVPL